MENIIKKAIEGGYEHSEFLKQIYGETYYDHATFMNYTMDAYFWQSLSKSCGWGVQIGDYKGDVHVNHDFNNGKCTELCQVPSVKNAMNFHGINLTEGWNKAVEYLEQITK